MVMDRPRAMGHLLPSPSECTDVLADSVKDGSDCSAGGLQTQPTNNALSGDTGSELRGIDGDLSLPVEGLSLTIEQLQRVKVGDGSLP